MKLLLVSLITGIPFGVLAEETTGGGQLPGWLQWSVLGAVIAALVTKQLVPGWAYNDRGTEIVGLKSENARLVDLVFETQKEVIPAIKASANAQERMASEMADLRKEGRRRGPIQT